MQVSTSGVRLAHVVNRVDGFSARLNREFFLRHLTVQSTVMAVTKGEEVGESSTSAAKKALKPSTNGIANYELPW